MEVLIPLTKGFKARIDQDDCWRVLQHSWSYQQGKGTGYGVARIDTKKVYLHRFIVSAPPNLQVDHVDLNGLNCVKTNLRICTHPQNNANKTKQSNNTSGYKGVCWDEERKCWKVQLRQGKRNYSSRHTSLQEAVTTYNRVAQEFFCEFARSNTLEGSDGSQE